jgi:hypothetical protein
MAMKQVFMGTIYIYIFRMSVITLWLCLSGCVHHNTVGVAACKLSCQSRLNICNQTCDNSCLQCAAKANHSTQRSYQRYVNEQCVRGGYRVRQLQSYRDPLQCRKITCECMADYQVCLQSCTGIIRKRLQVPLTCC